MAMSRKQYAGSVHQRTFVASMSQAAYLQWLESFSIWDFNYQILDCLANSVETIQNLCPCWTGLVMLHKIEFDDFL